MLSAFSLNDTPTTEIYTLSLHDALPISCVADWTPRKNSKPPAKVVDCDCQRGSGRLPRLESRSEEHTSELQSHSDLVCRLLLEKKKPEDSQARTAPTASASQSLSVNYAR